MDSIFPEDVPLPDSPPPEDTPAADDPLTPSTTAADPSDPSPPSIQPAPEASTPADEAMPNPIADVQAATDPISDSNALVDVPAEPLIEPAPSDVPDTSNESTLPVADSPPILRADTVERNPPPVTATPESTEQIVEEPFQRTFTTNEGQTLTIVQQPLEPLEPEVIVLKPDPALEQVKVVEQSVENEKEITITEVVPKTEDHLIPDDSPVETIERTLTMRPQPVEDETILLVESTKEPIIEVIGTEEPFQVIEDPIPEEPIEVIREIEEPTIEPEPVLEPLTPLISPLADPEVLLPVQPQTNNLEQPIIKIETIRREESPPTNPILTHITEEPPPGEEIITTVTVIQPVPKAATITAVSPPSLSSFSSSPPPQRAQSVYTLFPSVPPPAALLPPLSTPIAAFPSYITSSETLLLVHRHILPLRTGETHLFTTLQYTPLFRMLNSLDIQGPVRPRFPHSLFDTSAQREHNSPRDLVDATLPDTAPPILRLRPRRHRLTNLFGRTQWSIDDGQADSGGKVAGMQGLGYGVLKRHGRGGPRSKSEEGVKTEEEVEKEKKVERGRGRRVPITGWFAQHDTRNMQKLWVEGDLFGPEGGKVRLKRMKKAQEGEGGQDPVVVTVEAVPEGSGRGKTVGVGGQRIYEVRVAEGFDLALACATVVVADGRRWWWWSRWSRERR